MATSTYNLILGKNVPTQENKKPANVFTPVQAPEQQPTAQPIIVQQPIVQSPQPQVAAPATATQPPRGGMTAARLKGANNATSTLDATAAQTATATQPPRGGMTAARLKSKAESYEDIINRVLGDKKPQTEEEKKKEAKRRRREAIINAVGDGVSALANLYFTTRYAPNAYDPKNSLSAKAKERWDKLDNDRKENEENYLNAYLKAVKADRDDERADRQEDRDISSLNLKLELARNQEARDAAKEERDKELFDIYKQRANAALTADEADAKIKAAKARFADKDAELDHEAKALGLKAAKMDFNRGSSRGSGAGSSSGASGRSSSGASGRSSSGASGRSSSGASGRRKKFNSGHSVSMSNWKDDNYISELWDFLGSEVNDIDKQRTKYYVTENGKRVAKTARTYGTGAKKLWDAKNKELSKKGNATRAANLKRAAIEEVLHGHYDEHVATLLGSQMEEFDNNYGRQWESN